KSKLYTYADYLTWDFPQRVELFLGKVFPMSPAPNTRHQEVTAWLGFQFLDFFKHQPCRVFLAPFDVILPGINGAPESVLQPDIVIVCDEGKIRERHCYGAPDLVVEILSKSTRKRDLNEKLSLYQSAGVREYWVVDPVALSISLFIPGHDGRYHRAAFAMRGEQITSLCFPRLVVETEFVFRNIVREPQSAYRLHRRKDLRMLNRKVVRI
ncbi:MAG: Uma2 family endonuclease, partial [Bacteroidota bacterium]